ncbi:MAG: phage major capsid protein, partial [Myxococcota bacterium]
MLESVKISRRQSEIRQALAELAGKTTPTEDELGKMTELDAEYRSNETRYRAALVAEDTERREAGAELETREGREWSDLVAGFELRQVAMALDTGHQLQGRTAEIVSELRSSGGFRGVPVPWEALEVRVGETVATGTPDPVSTRPTIDRLFPQSVAAGMGAQMVNIDAGEVEWPVVTSAVSAGWADGETGEVAAPAPYATTDRPLAPDHTLGVQMKITRKALKQSGAALEQAVRRDMNGAMAKAMDAAVFLGSGSSGEPTGILPGAASFGITETAIDAAPDFEMIIDAIARFMIANAAVPGTINALIRPEVWALLMKAKDGDGNFMQLIPMIARDAGRVVVTSNALAAPSGSPAASAGLL